MYYPTGVDWDGQLFVQRNPQKWSTISLAFTITKTGNAHVRRVIVQSAWNYRYNPRVGVTLKKRQEAVSQEIKAISWNAQMRLNRKYRRMLGRGKTKQVVVIAVARELLGFIWAIAREAARERAKREAAWVIPSTAGSMHNTWVLDRFGGMGVSGRTEKR